MSKKFILIKLTDIDSIDSEGGVFYDYEKLENIPIYEDLIIYFECEVENLYPMDTIEMDPFQIMCNLHYVFQNHKGNIFYICSDLNIHERYKKWCDLYKPSKIFEVLYFPFYDAPESIYMMRKNKYNFIFEQIKKYKEKPKEKNFCLLAYHVKLIRAIIIDKFYTNKNFIYSFAPYYGDKLTENVVYQLHIPYKFTDNEYIKTSSLIDIDNNMFYPVETKLHLNIDGSCEKIFSFENGFNLFENKKRLTEIEYDFPTEVGIKEAYFNRFLPIESLTSCCDLVMESYSTKDAVFFSEKTWKEIVLKRPYLTFGAKNQYKFFKNMGFELYDEIFDYSFDNESVIENKINLFLREVEKYIDMEISEFQEIINVLSPKIEYNFNLFEKYLNQYEKFIRFLGKFGNVDTCDYNEARENLDFLLKNQIYHM